MVEVPLGSWCICSVHLRLVNWDIYVYGNVISKLTVIKTIGLESTYGVPWC